MATASSNIKTYRGNFIYQDVASREGEYIGLNLRMRGHLGVEVRFVARAESGNLGKFTHFTPRRQSEYAVLEDGEKTGATVGAVNLNRINLPLFLGNFYSTSEFYAALEAEQVPQKISDWIVQQLVMEGFMPIVNVLDFVKSQMMPKSEHKLVLTFPPEEVFKAIGQKDSGNFYGGKKKETKLTSDGWAKDADSDDDEEDEDDEFDVN